MTLSFNPLDDLVRVADGFQVVALRRPGSAQSLGIAHALRRPWRQLEGAVSGGHNMRTDTIWHFPTAELTFEPRLGDLVVDAAGRIWTVLEVARETLDARWRCVARNLALAHGLEQTVRLLRATWRRGLSGAVLPEWREAASGIAAHIQPVSAIEHVDGDRVALRTTHQVFVTELVAAEAEDVIVDQAGRTYRVVGFERPARIDALVALQVIENTGAVPVDDLA